IGGRDWYLDAAVVDSSYEFRDPGYIGRFDTSATRLQAALDACRDPADPLYNPDPPGCFNPFGNAVTTGTPNSQEIFDYFNVQEWEVDETKLRTYDLVLSGNLLDLPSGPLGVAVGMQLRQESYLEEDRKSTRLNSSHVKISYAVFCLKKKTRPTRQRTRGAA